MYQAGLEYIVGLKVHPNHFTIDPVIPASWPEFTLTYRRNNKTFVIEVINEVHIEHGVSAIAINGKIATGREIPYEDPSYGATVSVRVTLASADKASIAI
jgi:cyclic beta-1,2-glucan synthetase